MAASMIKVPNIGVILQALAIKASAAETSPPVYQLAAYQASVPSETLYSVALLESATCLRGQSTQLVLWPWSPNGAGAMRVEFKAVQIKIGLNSHRFGHGVWLNEALNRYNNLVVAAQTLAEMQVQGGDWITVESRSYRPAGSAPVAKYRELFAEHLSRVNCVTFLA